MSFTLIDAIVLAILVISTLLAWSRGLVREALSILGWIIALIVAARFAHLMVPVIENLPFIRDYISDSCELLTVIAFAILFIIMMVIMAVVTPLFSGMIQNSAFGTINSALGAIFGLLRGVVIVLLFFIIYDSFIQPSTPIETIDVSRSYSIFNNPKENVRSALPENDKAPSWLVEQFNKTTAHCRVPETDA